MLEGPRSLNLAAEAASNLDAPSTQSPL